MGGSTRAAGLGWSCQAATDRAKADGKRIIYLVANGTDDAKALRAALFDESLKELREKAIRKAEALAQSTAMAPDASHSTGA